MKEINYDRMSKIYPKVFTYSDFDISTLYNVYLYYKNNTETIEKKIDDFHKEINKDYSFYITTDDEIYYKNFINKHTLLDFLCNQLFLNHTYTEIVKQELKRRRIFIKE